MEAAAVAPASTTLPLGLRLRRAFCLALLLGLWAPVKIIWERDIADGQDALRYHGAPLTRQLRDELGQGLTIGVLSGMRSPIADLVWLTMVTAWMNQDFFKMGAIINLTTALQPRAAVFWDMGGWQLAWNASIAALHDPTQPNELRRIKASRFWADRGLDIYLRGIENNPDYWRLWSDTAQLYQQRLKDYPKASYYYKKASQLPNAPTFLERAPAEVYGPNFMNNPQAEYAEWVELWNRLTPQDKTEKIHASDKIEHEIRRLETQLAIPPEKRIFPK